DRHFELLVPNACSLTSSSSREPAMADETHPELAALLQRLQALEERQDRLEAKLQDRKAEKVKPPRPKPTLPPAPLPSFVKAVEVQAAEDIPAALPVDKPTTPEAVPSPRNVPMGESVSPPRSPEEPKKQRGRQTPQGLEQAIGLKWAGWIG